AGSPAARALCTRVREWSAAKRAAPAISPTVWSWSRRKRRSDGQGHRVEGFVAGEAPFHSIPAQAHRMPLVTRTDGSRPIRALRWHGQRGDPRSSGGAPPRRRGIEVQIGEREQTDEPDVARIHSGFSGVTAGTAGELLPTSFGEVSAPRLSCCSYRRTAPDATRGGVPSPRQDSPGATD